MNALLLQLLMTLQKEVVALEAQLAAMQSSTVAVVSSTPIGFVPWVPSSTQNASWTPPVWHQQTSSQMLPMPVQQSQSLVLGANVPTSSVPVSAKLITFGSIVPGITTTTFEYGVSKSANVTSFTISIYGPIPNFGNGYDFNSLPFLGTFTIPQDVYDGSYELYGNTAQMGMLPGDSYVYKTSVNSATQYDSENSLQNTLTIPNQ